MSQTTLVIRARRKRGVAGGSNAMRRAPGLAMAVAIASCVPTLALASSCVASADAKIAANLTSSWRLIKAHASSDDCQKLSCSGIISLSVTDPRQKPAQSDPVQVNIPFTISKGSHSTRFSLTRRIDVGDSDSPLERVKVNDVTCQNP